MHKNNSSSMTHLSPKYVFGIVVLSLSSISTTLSFTPPQQSIIHNSLQSTNYIIHTTRQPLFVQSKESIEIDRKDIISEKEINLIEEGGQFNLPKLPVYTTSEEASIFFADPEDLNVGIESTSANGFFWRGVVVILCALWASNFACAKVVLDVPGVDASLYAVARFSLAAVSLLPGTIIAVRKGDISWETTKGALVCGSWVAFGYLGQLIGLMTTTPSRACVICSLNCIFVAILAELVRVNETKERGYSTDFDLRKLIPALIAVTGVAIIELKGAAGGPVIGDLIAFTQPIGFGMAYLQLEELVKKQPSAGLPISFIKLAIVAVAACIFFESTPHAAKVSADLTSSVETLDAGLVVEGAKQSLSGITGLRFQIPDFTPILSSPLALGAIFYTGIVTTSLALWVESIAFQYVPATDASIILTTEPLFAAAASAVLVGETFGFSDVIGAAFIVGACITAVRMGESVEVCDEDTKKCYVDDI